MAFSVVLTFSQHSLHTIHNTLTQNVSHHATSATRYHIIPDCTGQWHATNTHTHTHTHTQNKKQAKTKQKIINRRTAGGQRDTTTSDPDMWVSGTTCSDKTWSIFSCGFLVPHAVINPGLTFYTAISIREKTHLIGPF